MEMGGMKILFITYLANLSEERKAGNGIQFGSGSFVFQRNKRRTYGLICAGITFYGGTFAGAQQQVLSCLRGSSALLLRKLIHN